MILRPRQKELVSRVLDALHTHNNTLAIAPTGAGKTIMLSAVVGEMLKDKHRRACVLAHRDELTCQNEGKFNAVNPTLTTSVFNARNKDWTGDATFAMVQTLARESNLQSMPALDLLVIDEAHHARANSYLTIINHARQVNPNIKLLGMTATPSRGDNKGLRPIFDNIADQITVKELINCGHLVPPRTFVMDIGVETSLKGVRKTMSDYDMGEVAKIMNKRPLNAAIVRHWQEKAGSRQTVVFCSTVKHARDITDSFTKKNIKTALIYGGMSDSERAQKLEDYRNGRFQVIVNVAVLTEGWDHPPTSCVVLLRPSSHKSTMIQMIGRGLRTVNHEEFPGVIKRDCVVLDFGISTLIHGSLEQDTSLDERKSQGEAPYKKCPNCDARIPARVKECNLCQYTWPPVETKKLAQTSNFNLEEIDILAKSNFTFEDLYNDGETYIATGFNAWAVVVTHEGNSYALGGRKNFKPQLLSSGHRTPCFTAANDWLDTFELKDTSHKDKPWLRKMASAKQLKYLDLPPGTHMTQYRASALLTYKFNKEDIQQVLDKAELNFSIKRVA